MAKRFTVVVSSDGGHASTIYEVEAQGFADAACALLCDPTRYSIPQGAVVGIEAANGTARFYKRRVGRNLYPISPKAAGLELWMGAHP